MTLTAAGVRGVRVGACAGLVALAACGARTGGPEAAAARVPAADGAPGHGVFTADLDRSVAPCDDFYAFANGSWRAANPIPASMQRWSRRWQAGDANKGRLRDILEDVSRTAQAKGSSEQLAGDYYASCMDEARVDAAGVGPIAKLLGEIDAMRGPADVQRMVRALHAIAVPVVFSFTATADAHDPGRTLGEVGAGGLGLPDRDSYLKTEPRFVTARAQYAAYLTQVLTLAGKPAAEAARLATMVFDVEKRLAIASLDNVALRNPKNTDHPTTMAELAALSPHLDWSAYFEEGRIARSGLNVAEPAFVQEVDRDLTSLPIDAWRAFSRRVSSARPRHGSPGPSPTRISASTSSSSPA